MQSEKPSPSALPDAVIQFNPPCLSFKPNYALKPPRSCLLQSHNSWRAAVSSRRLMLWTRRQLHSHKTALISNLKLIMWRWKDAAPLCVTVLPEPSEMRSSVCCFVLTCQATPLFLWGWWTTDTKGELLSDKLIHLHRSIKGSVEICKDKLSFLKVGIYK